MGYLFIYLQGVIFSIEFCSSTNRICSVSDDRSVRIWLVRFDGNLKDWNSAAFEPLHVLYGHSARVWDVKFLSTEIISIGEVSIHSCSAVQNQKVVSAYFTSRQILPFGFAKQCCYLLCACHSAYHRLNTYIWLFAYLNFAFKTISTHCSVYTVSDTTKFKYHSLFYISPQRLSNWSCIIGIMYRNLYNNDMFDIASSFVGFNNMYLEWKRTYSTETKGSSGTLTIKYFLGSCINLYSRTCYEQPPLWHKKSGILMQVDGSVFKINEFHGLGNMGLDTKNSCVIYLCKIFIEFYRFKILQI